MDTIQIAVCLNDNYVMPTAVLLQSIGANKDGEQILIHAISIKELKDDSKRILNSLSEKHGMKVEYHIFEVPEMVCTSSTCMRYWSYDVFLKLYIPTILPDLEKVLILDGDMIVRHSLSELWNEDIRGVALAGVPDSGIGVDPCHKIDVLYDIKYGYVNGGMLLMNLEYHRTHNLQQKYLDWIKENPGRIVFNEQTIINNVVYDCHRNLPLKYNLHFISNIWKYKNNRRYSKKERKSAYYNPTIIHYICRTKPWHRLCPHPYVNEWNKYLKQTPFRNYHKEMQKMGGGRNRGLRQITVALMLCLNSRFLFFLRLLKLWWI